MKAEDYAKQFQVGGYELLATNGPKTWFNLAAKDMRHAVQIWDKASAVDQTVVTAQITIAVRGFMGEIKSWEFTLPNNSFGKAMEQINKIDRMFQMHLGEDGNINDWNF